MITSRLTLSMEQIDQILSLRISPENNSKNNFERILWFSYILKWLQTSPDEIEKQSKKETLYARRIRYILLILSKNKEDEENFIHNVRLLVLQLASSEQLSQAGRHKSNSFIHELAYRLQEKILPTSSFSEDLTSLIFLNFSRSEEAEYIQSIDHETIDTLFNLFKNETDLNLFLKLNVLEASFILSHDIFGNSMILLEELGQNHFKVHELKEFQLEGLLRKHQEHNIFDIPLKANELFDQIEIHLDSLNQLMKKQGVKIDLVYLFHVQRRKMKRLKIFLSYLTKKSSAAETFNSFLSDIIIETQHQNSLRSFFSENLNLMTHRIVQANSYIGEHYVTHNWIEFKRMFASALGGGAVTAYTVIIKQLISKLQLTGFIKGLIDSLNYSGSFLLIQALGYTLATKQPSMTAPYIAAALEKNSKEEIKKSISALLRTQFIAVLGNLTLVFPICYVFSLLCLKTDLSYLTNDDAKYILNSTKILGPAPFFAIFTGFLLFLSSLFAGWFENWVHVNKIESRLLYNEKFKKYFGLPFTRFFAELISKKSNPLAANISLGFLLGLLPQFLKFFNLPIEVRHITLSTGAFATALPLILENTLASTGEIINATSGLLAIGLLNISISFLLAFSLASIAKKIT